MTPQAPPNRSYEQRMEGLRRANDVRVKRAQLKMDIKKGRIRARDVLADPPYYVETMKVYQLLLSLPKFGQFKATRLLNQVHISPAKTVERLSDRQRDELIKAL